MGLFDCPRSHPWFSDSGPARGDLVVFPRYAVEISHPAREPVIADARTITLYNKDQSYGRRPVSLYGDQSFWLRFARGAVVEALLESEKGHKSVESEPFLWTHSRCTPETYMAARSLFRILRDGRGAEELRIEEQAYRLLRAAIATAPEAYSTSTTYKASTVRRHHRLVARCRGLMASRFHESLSLEEMATELATTPYHLCRIFAEQTGQTLHSYLMDLRLCAAVDQIIDDPRRRLTDISADLGFSTPSHFSRRFRQRFGSQPSAFRSA
jgi:AraC-like DNA-binding protein